MTESGRNPFCFEKSKTTGSIILNFAQKDVYMVMNLNDYCDL